MAISPSSALKKRLPRCIIIGEKKCGTRALLDFLDLHPEIEAAPDEIHFFDKDRNYRKGIEWYRQEMPLTRANQLAIEKSPAYFRTPSVPSRVFAMNSTIKLILLVRDPTERVISDITQTIRKKNITRKFTDFKMKDYMKEINTSKYNKHFKIWLEWFPRENIHIVSTENLTLLNPYVELKKIEEFLGLKSFYASEMFKYDETKGFYCMHDTKDTLRCLGDDKGRKHVELSEESVRKMQSFFKEYNQQFYNTTGINFKWAA